MFDVFKESYSFYTEPTIDIDIEKLFFDKLEEDGYYHLCVNDLIQHGFLNNPDVYYTINKSVALTGDFPEHIKITNKKGGVFTLREPRATDNHITQIGGTEYGIDDPHRVLDKPKPNIINLKIIGDKDKPATLGTGSVINVDGTITLENVRLQPDAKVFTMRGPMEVNVCITDKGSLLAAVWEKLNIKNSFLEGDVATTHHELHISHSQINGHIDVAHKPCYITHSCLQGSIQTSNTPLHINDSHIQGQVANFHSRTFFENCTKSESSRFDTCIYQDMGFADIPLRETQRTAFDDFETKTILRHLDAMTDGKIAWRTAEVDGEKIYTTVDKIKLPQAMIFFLQDALKKPHLTMPPKGEGKPSIPASQLNLASCLLLDVLDKKELAKLLYAEPTQHRG